MWLEPKVCSSKQCSRDSNSSGRNSFDLNKRTLIALCENGQGYAAMTMFCWCMDMPYSDLHNAYVQTVQESMPEPTKTAYNNLANINANSNCSQNARVSDDSAW